MYCCGKFCEGRSRHAFCSLMLERGGRIETRKLRLFPPPHMSVRTLLADTPELLRRAYDLRLEVFTEEQGYDPEVDSYDRVAVPMLLQHEGTQDVVGVIRILPAPLPKIKHEFYARSELASDALPGADRSEADMKASFLEHQVVQEDERGVRWYSGAKIGRLAVKRDFRGQGYGRIILRDAEEWVRRTVQEGQTASGRFGVAFQLSSQEPVRGFYEAEGYRIVGDAYMEEGQPHIHCEKRVLVGEM